MPYTPPVFVDVPPGTTAPGGAPKINSATLNNIVTAVDGIDDRVTALEAGTATTDALTALDTRLAAAETAWRTLASFGAKGDCVSRTGGATTTASSTTLNVTSGTFTTTDVGKKIFVRGAGTSGAVLQTTIAAVNTANQVVLAAATPTAVSNARFYYGTDDTAAVQAAFNSGAVVGGPGNYLTGALTWPTRMHFRGSGPGLTRFVRLPGGTGPHISLAAAGTAELLDCSHFSVDGKRHFQTSSTASGIYVATDGVGLLDASFYGSNDPAHVLSHIMIHDTKGDGYQTGGRGTNRTSHMRIYNCDGHGVVVDNYDSYYDHLEVGVTGLHGIYGTPFCSNSRFTSVKVFYSGQIDRVTSGDGIYLQGSRNQFSGVEIQNAGRQGVFLDGSGLNVFNGLYIEFPSNPATTNDGLVLNDSSYNVVTGIILDKESPSHLNRGIVLRKTTPGCAGNAMVVTVLNTLSGPAAYEGGQTFAHNSIMVNGEVSFQPDLQWGYLRTANDDTAAAAAGINLYSVYRTTAGVVRMRVS